MYSIGSHLQVFSDQFIDIGNSKVFEITAARELSVTYRLTEKRLKHWPYKITKVHLKKCYLHVIWKYRILAKDLKADILLSKCIKGIYFDKKMKLRWLGLYLWRDHNVRGKLVAEIKCIYHRMTTSLMFPDRQRRRYITAVGCDCSCVNYMAFYCRAGNCKCQGTEVSDIKEDSMVREHVKHILISLPGLCSPTPWSQNSKGWWESGWVEGNVIWGHREAELTETDSLWPKHGIAFPFPWNWAGSVCGCKQSLSRSFHKAQEPEPWKLRGRWEKRWTI